MREFSQKSLEGDNPEQTANRVNREALRGEAQAEQATRSYSEVRRFKAERSVALQNLLDLDTLKIRSVRSFRLKKDFRGKNKLNSLRSFIFVLRFLLLPLGRRRK